MATAILSSRDVSALLIHGRRRVKANMLDQFRECYAAYSSAARATPGMRAVFAFAAPDSPSSFFHVVWANDVASLKSAQWRAGPAYERLLATYASTSEDPDTLTAYGSCSELRRLADESMQGADLTVRYVLYEPIAGFMRSDGAGKGLPLIGFTERHVQNGRVKLLAPAFQAVCDLWFDKVPGILAATVSPDPSEPNLVHDVRIFADHAAFQAHVDKSDPVLTDKMEQWFAHYDTSIPFTAELYMPSASTKDDEVRTSSIQDRPIRNGFSEFVFDENGIWGCN